MNFVFQFMASASVFGLIGLLLILIQFYDLGLIKSFLVVILMFLVQLGIGVVLAKLAEPIG